MARSLSSGRDGVLDEWERARRAAEERAEVAVHVRLVGVPGRVGGVGERLPGPQQVDGVLEAQQPGDGLGCEADLPAEALGEVAPAPAGVARELLDPHGAV